MGLTSYLLLIGVLLGQASTPPGPDRPEDPASRLEFMKKSLAIYDLRAIDDRGTRFRLRPEPILRFTNPVGGSQDGAIFFWVDEQGRPGAVVQVFRKQEGPWSQEFVSLSTSPLVAEARSGPGWTPSRGGVELRPVPDAPKPAATAEQRLLQMRALARDFAAEDYFKNKTWSALRLLPKPLARYGKPGSDVTDGALFCFALTTDPEVLLILEARTGKEGLEWQYAFAPMTTFAVKGSWKGREVWSLPARFGIAKEGNATFHIRPIPGGSDAGGRSRIG